MCITFILYVLFYSRQRDFNIKMLACYGETVQSIEANFCAPPLGIKLVTFCSWDESISDERPKHSTVCSIYSTGILLVIFIVRFKKLLYIEHIRNKVGKVTHAFWACRRSVGSETSNGGVMDWNLWLELTIGPTPKTYSLPRLYFTFNPTKKYFLIFHFIE